MIEQRNKPVLIYDGDCGICQYWVNYWHKLTGDNVSYRPYQAVAADYPEIPLEEFQRAIQFIDTDGQISSGAKATCNTLRDVAPWGLLLTLYRYLPGFSLISEGCYTFFSRRRGLLRKVSYLLWGKEFEPPRYEWITWLFLRFLALVYLGAFISLGIQITGLVGSDGILPVSIYLENTRAYYGDRVWFLLPTLFWLNASNASLLASCIAGAVFSVLLFFNRWPWWSLTFLYCLYLSLTVAGQHFMSYQWDLLLLEAGFLAIFLGTRSSIIVWLYRWLMFRYIFISGVVKLASQDPTWSNLTALQYHFETQPLPTPLAWYAHHLPDKLLMGMTAGTLVIEVLIPFLLFMPRHLRCIAGILFIILQGIIILTGNYNFFNLLTIALCLFLFDDAAIKWLLPAGIRQRQAPGVTDRKPQTLMAAGVAVLILSTSGAQLSQIFTRTSSPVLQQFTEIVQPFGIVNIYGPFSVMTTKRNEIMIEGSNDGQNWLAYDFRYKPDDPAGIPGWIIPHQPRLDWQMWFAALDKPENNLWFGNLVFRILQGKEDVLRLLKNNPFPEQPPRYLRANLYHYRFTDPEMHRESGDWWTRELTETYLPLRKLSADRQ